MKTDSPLSTCGSPAPRWWQGVLCHRLLPWLSPALACVLYLPTITFGFFGDDHFLRCALHARLGSHNVQWFDLYRFTGESAANNQSLIDDGILPWWSSPHLRLHFVRPLTSMLFTADEYLFGSNAVWYRIHSIAWYVALVATIGFLFRRILPNKTANLALVIFTINASHAGLVGWISARHFLIGATLASIGLAAWISLRSRYGDRAMGISLVGGVIGLRGSEAALGIAFFAAAYSWHAPSVGGVNLDRRWRTLPWIALVVTYVVAYKLIGGGAQANEGYVDPSSGIGAYVGTLGTRIPALLANAIFAMPSELVLVGASTACVLAGVVAFVFVLTLLRRTRARLEEMEVATLRWVLPGTVFALVANAGGFPSSRLLLVPNVGFSVLIAVLIMRTAIPLARLALVVVHLVLAPIAIVATTCAYHSYGRKIENTARAAVPQGSGARPRVFVIGASDPFVFMYVHGLLRDTGNLSCWSTLSAARSSHRVTRVSERTLDIEAMDSTWLQGPFESLYRSLREPLHVGDGVRQCGAFIEVVAMQRSILHRVRVTFDRSIEDPSVDLLAWRNGKLQRINLAVGSSEDFSWTVGPSGFF